MSLLVRLFVHCNYNSCISLARIPAWCIVQVGKLIGVSYELQGLENINRDHGGVVLINHQSAIDLIGNLLSIANSIIFVLYKPRLYREKGYLFLKKR